MTNRNKNDVNSVRKAIFVMLSNETLRKSFKCLVAPIIESISSLVLL